ncbi:hypothetical protein E5161_14855 [Cohnella pontilimi]|uniref:Uncharacterized protein n=1 Tax=Cohnella pontilimi TaxID=2564100 RepID=A0A4U0F8N0_9BACL|nr:hypothetical protein [Cohnella pontilimi]TJY40991.1 hypothetical protein E5161_14855 [Cohnella pontilimi]
MRRAGVWMLLVMGLGAVVTLVFYQLWLNEHRGELAFKAAHGFPNLDPVTSIEVSSTEGMIVRPAIQDQAAIANIMTELRNAPRTYFGDPEPSGTLYRISIHVSKRVHKFELNDMRSPGSRVSGKIYPVDGGPKEVWQVSAQWIEKLLSER